MKQIKSTLIWSRWEWSDQRNPKAVRSQSVTSWIFQLTKRSLHRFAHCLHPEDEMNIASWHAEVDHWMLTNNLPMLSLLMLFWCFPEAAWCWLMLTRCVVCEVLPCCGGAVHIALRPSATISSAQWRRRQRRRSGHALWTPCLAAWHMAYASHRPRCGETENSNWLDSCLLLRWQTKARRLHKVCEPALFRDIVSARGELCGSHQPFSWKLGPCNALRGTARWGRWNLLGRYACTTLHDLPRTSWNQGFYSSRFLETLNIVLSACEVACSWATRQLWNQILMCDMWRDCLWLSHQMDHRETTDAACT